MPPSRFTAFERRLFLFLQRTQAHKENNSAAEMRVEIRVKLSTHAPFYWLFYVLYSTPIDEFAPRKKLYLFQPNYYFNLTEIFSQGDSSPLIFLFFEFRPLI